MEPKIIRDNTPGIRPVYVITFCEHTLIGYFQAGKRIPREGNAGQCLDILSNRVGIN